MHVRIVLDFFPARLLYGDCGMLMVLAGVTLAFVEPPEARKPTTRWRLYVFKDGEPLNGMFQILV